MVRDLGRARRVEHRRNGLAQLAECDIRGVALEDVAELLDLARERPLRAALAVGQGPAGDRESSEVVDNPAKLGRNPALSDAGGAEHRDEMWPALADDALPDPAENLELPLATDDGVRRRGLVVDELRAHSHPRVERLGLSLCDDRIRSLVLDRAPRGAVRLVADKNAVDRRPLLQAGGGVHNTARHHRLAVRRACGERDEGLAGVDRDPEAEIEPGLLT